MQLITLNWAIYLSFVSSLNSFSCWRIHYMIAPSFSKQINLVRNFEQLDWRQHHFGHETSRSLLFLLSSSNFSSSSSSSSALRLSSSSFKRRCQTTNSMFKSICILFWLQCLLSLHYASCTRQPIVLHASLCRSPRAALFCLQPFPVRHAFSGPPTHSVQTAINHGDPRSGS